MELSTIKVFAAIITPVILFLLGLGVGIIGYFLKSMHNDFKSSFKTLNDSLAELESRVRENRKDLEDRTDKNRAHVDEKVQKVDDKIYNLQSQLPREYVPRRDVFRMFYQLDQKVSGLPARFKTCLNGVTSEPGCENVPDPAGPDTALPV